jgi:TRAP-type C4-dicarboxylate transport system permease small subunit
MKSGIERLRAGARQLSRVAEWVSVAMFIGIFVLFIAAIVQRYALRHPVDWVDEGIMILFLWSTFLTEALVLREREQVTFDVLYDACGPRARRLIGLVASALVAVLFALAAPTIWGYIAFLWREKTNAFEWRLDFVYACFFLYWIAVIVRALDKLLTLLQPGWQALVADSAPDEKANVLG